MTMLWIALGGIGLFIIVVLAVYAGRLLAQVKQQQQRRDQAIAKRNDNLIESITTISKAMQQGQCELSEGALRVVVLLDHLGMEPKPDFAQEYPGIHEMYERIKQMPTHDALKAYPKAEIRKLDREREGYEKELEGVIQDDVSKLLARFYQKPI